MGKSIHSPYHREIKLFRQIYTNANKFDFARTMAGGRRASSANLSVARTGPWRWQFARNAPPGVSQVRIKVKFMSSGLNYTRCVQSNGIVSGKWAGSAAGWRAHTCNSRGTRRRSSMSAARQLSNLRNKRPPLGLRRKKCANKSPMHIVPCHAFQLKLTPRSQHPNWTRTRGCLAGGWKKLQRARQLRRNLFVFFFATETDCYRYNNLQAWAF